MRLSAKWGVDSAESVDEAQYHCVKSKMGTPSFWGRYLKTTPGGSAGLTTDEIQLLRSKGTKILPIYNDYKSAVGYDEGTVVAGNAVYSARRLGFPKDTFIFADIEHDMAVDGAWIRGWVDALFPTGFRPGIYASPMRGKFNTAYCEAVSEDSRVGSQTVIWSMDPEQSPTSANKAPVFHPSEPSCSSNVWLWQYGRGAEACKVDTNLALSKFLPHLW